MIIAAATVASQARRPRVDGRTFRIGFQNSPPSHFPDAHGNPTGPAVELIKIAAGRHNIKLEWVWWPEKSDDALTSKTVDIWPVLADIPDRRPRFHITAPFHVMTIIA